jgi:hypothetical protein
MARGPPVEQAIGIAEGNSDAVELLSRTEIGQPGGLERARTKSKKGDALGCLAPQDERRTEGRIECLFAPGTSKIGSAPQLRPGDLYRVGKRAPVLRPCHRRTRGP